jgi:hypothetical protein
MEILNPKRVYSNGAQANYSARIASKPALGVMEYALKILIFPKSEVFPNKVSEDDLKEYYRE